MALAIPLRRDDFLEDLRPTSAKEYAKWYKWERGGAAILDTGLWEHHYGPKEATPILGVVEEVQSLGVKVVCRCTLADFVALLRERPIVGIAAHWRTGMVQRSDLLDPAGFLAHVDSSDQPLLAILRDSLTADTRSALTRARRSAGVDTAAIDAILTSLNGLLATVDLTGTPSGRNLWKSPPEYLVEQNRRVLNRALPSILAASGGLELYDRTYSAETLRDTIPPGYSGLLELMVCHSVVPAEAIKRAHPACRIIANRQRTPPLLRLLIFREAMHLLTQHARSYLDVVTDIRRNLHLERGSMT